MDFISNAYDLPQDQEKTVFEKFVRCLSAQFGCLLYELVNLQTA